MFLLFVLLHLGVCYAYENLALRKPAHQDHPYWHMSWLTGASHGVDGQKSNLSFFSGQCVCSANEVQTATWWVNLTSILSIHHITIYYRTENVAWGESNGFTSRFLGFSLYISNTTNRSQGSLCFKDSHFNRSTIPTPIDLTCPAHGQYVIYYNERKPGVTYPAGYSQYAYNDICELEVYGCPIPGYYGVNCSTPCPDPNCRYCHIETGACQGCKPGYRGHQCELECWNGTYGEVCNGTCGHCLANTVCNHVNGTCESGCTPGYQGGFCKEPCVDGKYGLECNNTCGHCLDGDHCNKVNGTCIRGCSAGYNGSDILCKTACANGTYGFDCNETCGKCKDQNDCFHVNGSCLNSCSPGFDGDLCKTPCDDGKYGLQCNDTCGHCLDGDHCNKVNGTCIRGCNAGYKNDMICKTACADGFFGDNCTGICNTTCDSCNKVNGSCDSGCHPGWKGNYCNEKCDNGTYGKECKSSCGHCFNQEPCYHINGTCLTGCESGYLGNLCQSPASQPATEWKTWLISSLTVILAVGAGVAAVCVIQAKRRGIPTTSNENEMTAHMSTNQ
ncbi:uncharacterized protein LOC111113020 isoform X6 [Crassostrea virginica]